MLLKFLGRGSAFNIKEGNNSSFIKDNDELLLIDCGENIFERIINKKILNEIKKVNVVITHLDSDHVGSLSSLIYYCHFVLKIKIDVYFPTKELKELLDLQGHTEEDYTFKLINSKICNSISNITIMPIQVKHIKTLHCFGYLISFKNKTIWYSGDCNDPIPNFLNNFPKIDEYYQDTCLTEYEGNVHTHLSLLSDKFLKDRNKVYCMHLDNSDVLIKKAKELGFNVVENI